MIKVKLFFLIFLFFSCDFTSHLQKEILEAQKSIKQQEFSKAIIQYDRLLNKNLPKNMKIKINFQLGELYSIYLRESDKAISHYKKIKDLTDDPHWLVRTEEKIGEINFTIKKNSLQSIESYQKLVNFVPPLKKQDFYEYRLGLSYLEANLLNECIHLFLKISQDTKHEYQVEALYYLGLAYFQSKRWKIAIKYLSDYTKKETRKDRVTEAKLLMANSYETMEKLKEAYDLYYSILGEYPHTEVIKNRMKSLYSRRIARKR